MNLAILAIEQGDLPQARLLLRQASQIYLDLQRIGTIPTILDGFARLAAAEGRARRAVRLAGAATSQREQLNVVQTPRGEVELERSLRQARAALSAEAHHAVRVEGRAMTREQALAYALATLNPA